MVARIMDFEKEYDIHQLSEILRTCRASFCAALVEEVEQAIRENPSLLEDACQDEEVDDAN